MYSERLILTLKTNVVQEAQVFGDEPICSSASLFFINCCPLQQKKRNNFFPCSFLPSLWILHFGPISFRNKHIFPSPGQLKALGSPGKAYLCFTMPKDLWFGFILAPLKEAS